MLRIEREDHVIPLEFDDQGRVMREAQADAIRIHLGKILLIIGMIRRVY